MSFQISKLTSEALNVTKAFSTASLSKFQNQRKGDSKKGKRPRGTKKSKGSAKGVGFRAHGRK